MSDWLFHCICGEEAPVKSGHDLMDINDDLNIRIVEDDDNHETEKEEKEKNEVITKKKRRTIKTMAGLFDGVYCLKEQMISNINESNEPIHDHITNLDVPKIALVGSQSSGKSTLLNRIIGHDVIPTGDNMVTRTPLHVALKHGEESRINLSFMESGKRITVYEKKIDNFDNFDNKELSKKIEDTTNHLTGGKYLISDSPIFLEIVKNNLFDLTIIDLPGIVTLACTDKGQPETIVDDIKNLIESQLSSDNVFVIVVAQAKTDLETDIGLSTIKNLTKKFTKMKTMGVLTKADCLDKKSLKRFAEIFSLSKKSDISLDYGYYVVNNSLPPEYQRLQNQAQWYHNFFGSKSTIILQKKYGIHNVIEALVRNINLFLLTRVNSLKRDLENMRSILKSSIPLIGNETATFKSKLLYVMDNCYLLSREISDAINSLGNHYNIGSNIRSILDELEKETCSLDVFNKKYFADAKLKSIINSFESFTQSSKNINLIIRKCFFDTEANPLQKIKNIFLSYIERLYDLLVSTFVKFAAFEHVKFSKSKKSSIKSEIQNYPKIIEFITRNNTEILNKFKEKAKGRIDEFLDTFHDLEVWYDENDVIEMEAETISHNQANNSDDDDAKTNTKTALQKRKSTVSVLKLFDEPIYNINQIRCLVNVVFKKIIIQFKELAIKTLFSTFINGYSINLYSDLSVEINNLGDIDELFYSTLDKIKEARKIEDYIEDIDSFLKFISTYENKY
jgi:GTPase SAR1 family protein